MILPDCVLKSRVDLHTKFCGMDSLGQCRDKKHFINYPHDIDYVYNSRGFRDCEWPDSLEELSKCVWCLGDSFTVGIGQPYHHIWPQVLSQQTGLRTINVSMDGASNDWIFRKALNIMENIAPKHMVLMWSYTHRCESPDTNQSDEQRRVAYSHNSTDQDTDHWRTLTNQIKTQYPSVIQLSVPMFMPNRNSQNLEALWQNVKDSTWPPCPRTLSDLENLPAHILKELQDFYHCYEDIKQILCQSPSHVIYIDQKDYARDYHHFDIVTSRWVVQELLHYLHG